MCLRDCVCLQRTGEHEAHATLPLGGADAVGASVCVGDYEVRLTERVAPLCTLNAAQEQV